MTGTPRTNVTVLLVDDEPEFLASVSRVLARRGFQVLTAASGDEARQIFKAAPIDVAVLDVRLPDMDGHELFYEVKSLRAETQVIMLTGHGDPREAFEMGSLGVFDYLSKPCDVDYLAGRIQQAVSGQGLRSGESQNEGISILLVDDEVDFLSSMKRILVRRGFAVRVAVNGQQALDDLAEHPANAVILDVRMPGPSGTEVLGEIKKLHPETAVIMLTGHATVETAAQCMKKGAFDYLFKPHSPEDLVNKILLAVENSRR